NRWFHSIGIHPAAENAPINNSFGCHSYREGKYRTNPRVLKATRRRASSSQVSEILFSGDRRRKPSRISAALSHSAPINEVCDWTLVQRGEFDRMEGWEESCKDYYKVLEVDFDATDERIRLNYRKLALKWHPDKHNGNSAVTAKFQEINEAYKVLSDPAKRLDYDMSGSYIINRFSLREYLARFKGMILTCNGLGIDHSSAWTNQLVETEAGDQ
ncbi:DnaJ domain-containing protein, partial [Dioscorea alata]